MFPTKVYDKFKAYFVFNNFLSKDRATYEITWGNVEEPDRPEISYDACALHFWTTETHTHTEYVILTTFSRQQWLRECICLTVTCVYT